MERISQLEALLFVAGEEGISLDELAFILEIKTATVYQTIEKLKIKYQQDISSALHILEVGNQFVLTTKKNQNELLKKYAQSPMANHLSQAALEALSIVAYKQPITRLEIEEIRGVQSSGAIQRLVSRNLIEEKGRVDGPGRAIIYGTTNYFMNYFGLERIQDLPSIEEMENEIDKELPTDLFFKNFKEELAVAEEEAQEQARKAEEEQTE